MLNNKPRILVLDIETKPALAYVWRVFKENISPDQIVDSGGMLCFGAKWFGEKEKIFFSEWEHGRRDMVQAAHDLLSEADAVVTFNGDKFDLPKMNGEFLLQGLKPIPPLTSIDTIKTVRKMGLIMNRLAYVGPLLKVGAKIKHEGFDLWIKVMNGDVKAQARMQKYCNQDVALTERLYRKIRPFILNHPHLGKINGNACGACGSKHVQKRGTYRTKYFHVQRLQCQSCGSWSTGVRNKIKTNDNG